MKEIEIETVMIESGADTGTGQGIIDDVLGHVTGIIVEDLDRVPDLAIVMIEDVQIDMRDGIDTLGIAPVIVVHLVSIENTIQLNQR